MYFYLFCCTAYYITYQLINNCTSHYPDTSSIVTKEYRIVNKVKSFILCIISPAGTYVLYQALAQPNDPYILDFFAASYTALDMSALIYNPNSHMSTTVHHILVQFLYGYCYWANFNMNTLVKGIAFYALFSCYAYLVNYRLAIRYINHKYENAINILALRIYIFTCLCNWLVQVYLLFLDMTESHILEKIIYSGLIAMIMNDDVFLMKFLGKSSILENDLIICSL